MEFTNGHRLLDVDSTSTSSEPDPSCSRPMTGADGTYEDDFERGLESELSCSYDDDDDDQSTADGQKCTWTTTGYDITRTYLLDPTAYRDSDEDLEKELTLGLGRRPSNLTTYGANGGVVDKDASNGRTGTARVFIDFLKRSTSLRNLLDARSSSEPPLDPSKDNFYDAPDEVGYDSTPDSGHDSFQALNMDPEQRTKQLQEWRNELFMIEEEIQTLRSVLSAKVRRTQDLKRNLGITVWREFREDMEQGIKNVKDSDACKSMNDKLGEFHQALTSAPLFQKTETVLKTAGEKTTTVLGTLGASVRSKLGEVKNSPTFKSLEERVGSAYTNVKTRVSSRSSSVQNFDDLSDCLSDSTGATPATTPCIPEEKPLL